MGNLRTFIAGAIAAGVLIVGAHGAHAVEVSESATFKASADEVWQIVNEFGGLHEWHPWFVATTVSNEDGGLRRLIVTGDGGWAYESLDDYSWAGKSMTYTVLESVFPIANYSATLKVSESGGGATINWSSKFDAAGMSDEDAAKLIADAYQAGFDSIKAMTGE